MSTTIAKAIEEDFAYAERLRARASETSRRLRALAEVEADHVFTSNLGGDIDVTLVLYKENAGKAPTLTRRVLAALRLPRASKVFNESIGAVDYIVLGERLKVIIRAAPTRCKIKLVEEPVEVPAQPASTVIRKRYVIENPEECGAAPGPIPKDVSEHELAREKEAP